MLDRALDTLYSTPVAGFVQERKRLAQELKAAGRKDDAKAIEKLPRPSVPAWAINQLSRREPKLIAQLAALTDELQHAQGTIARGGDAGPDYAAAAVAHRQVLGTLRDRTEAILTEAGQAASPALLARVVASLRAGIGRPDGRAAIEAGRLSHEVGVEEEPFASLLGAAVAAGPPRGGAPAKAKAKAADAEDEEDAEASPTAPSARSRATAAQAMRDQQREDARRTREREAAAREAERFRARARAVVEEKVERARAAADKARTAADKADRARAAAREALAEAERRWDAARLEAQTAARELVAAEEELVRFRS